MVGARRHRLMVPASVAPAPTIVVVVPVASSPYPLIPSIEATIAMSTVMTMATVTTMATTSPTRRESTTSSTSPSVPWIEARIKARIEPSSAPSAETLLSRHVLSFPNNVGKRFFRWLCHGIRLRDAPCFREG